jgi:hypothetical protein
MSAAALERLRPHPHRGDVIAAGAVALAAGVVMLNVRMDDPWGPGVHLVLTGAAAVLVLGMGLLAPLEGPDPRPYQSTLLVAGLLLGDLALLRLADILGADGVAGSSAALFWTQLATAAGAAYAARRCNSAVCTLIAAVTGAVAVLALVDWVFSPDGIGTFRYLLLLLALAYALASLGQRQRRPRHGVQLVNAAGLATLSLEATWTVEVLFNEGDVGTSPAGWGWELFMLAASWGLLAYAAVDRESGPAYLGFVALLGYVLIAGLPGKDGASLIGWPILLLLVGGAGLAVGLRPRRPLPPSPDAGAPPAPTTPIAPRP